MALDLVADWVAEFDATRDLVASSVSHEEQSLMMRCDAA